jgi:Holliday junction resolvase
MKGFSSRREQLMTLSRKNIEALRQAAAEVREFHEFYPVAGVEIKADKNALTYLSADEVEEILDIETMFAQFEQFYSQSHY